MKTLLLEGEVFSGKGEGTEFIKLPWVRKQIKEKLGFTPYLGTLNIRLTERSVILKNLLKNAQGIEITPAEGFHRGVCFKAYLMGLECAVVIPEVQDYPENTLEVVAPTKLREHLKLKDGSIIEIKVLLKK
ncbi:CTP-dependent riboflavin kinase [Candidatus Bathyarchaeota archaeon]|nr:MAG: CTP-dependent riboflavin kinase [Candidatus Bathyarchaeota archaeon]